MDQYTEKGALILVGLLITEESIECIVNPDVEKSCPDCRQKLAELLTAAAQAACDHLISLPNKEEPFKPELN